MSRARALPLAALLLLLVAGPAAAGEAPEPPCRGVTLADGQVELGRTLRLADAGAAETDACLAAIARAIGERPAIRSVLVAARVDGGEKARREASEAATHIARRLAAHGVPQAHLSVVVPRTRKGEPDSVRITYVERRPLRPVAQVFAASGRVQAGLSQSSLTPASPGAVLASHQLVETAPGAAATVHLVDGTRLWIGPDALVRLGDITATGRRRQVELGLLRGEVHVRASDRDGPLRLITPNARVDVQATRFRATLTEAGQTRVETLTGTVSFSGQRGQVFITRAEGSSVDASGYPDEPRQLLLAPRVLEPILGPRGDGELLVWEAVPNAAGYRVEFARNAQFDDTWFDVVVRGDRMLVGAAHTPGKWFWRVTAIDPAGFGGLPSKTFAFTVPAQ